MYQLEIHKKRIKEKGKGGSLKFFSLWDFWDGLGNERQNEILTCLYLTPRMWDPDSLFFGNSLGNGDHGPIGILNRIFIHTDLITIDIFYEKFKEYSIESYQKNNSWSKIWQSSHKQKVKFLKSSKFKKRLGTDNQLIENIPYINLEVIYWTDAHFFLQKFSKLVYKSLIRGEITCDRFLNAVNFEIKNIKNIHDSLYIILGCEVRNVIIEQVLIYLEKIGNLKKCKELILLVKDLGWTNNFEKRLERCNKKLMSIDI